MSMNNRVVITNGDTDNVRQISEYLPSNYWIAGVLPDTGVVIEGIDSMGWTAEDYVLPRLNSGLYFGFIEADIDLTTEPQEVL